ncbi:UDP-N-acetylglucosamine 2-epimerase (non-hydrolyzing) [Candidatus Dojkabacteria bacterium]|nr:UDP-N-acetylglucosamine 2-epimerase (non-hydrolyzing) [Candidatus Dojkabacteria bacterium]
MKVVVVAGARPNFIKIAGLYYQKEKFPNLDFVLIHTGQHYDDSLSSIFFEQLRIAKPDINLKVETVQSGSDYIAAIDDAVSPVLLSENPDVVVVVGDVNSTAGSAKAAKGLGIDVAHIESGLRSHDLSMPEEKNRIYTDSISDYLFVTETDAVKNLRNENISQEKIFFVGNIMIDTLINNLETIKKQKVMRGLGLTKECFAFVTFHRPSNVDEEKDLQNVLNILREVSMRIKVMIPLHPRTKKSLEKFGLYGYLKNMPNVVLSNPLGYFECLNLVLNSKLVLTDSGGLQEESTFLHIPCITMRTSTERPITIEEGTNILAGVEREKVLSYVDMVLNDQYSFPNGLPELWDGKTAHRILKILSKS